MIVERLVGLGYILACGATWFGFINLRPLRLLGLESYSLYLSNIVIFFVAFELFILCAGVATSIAFAPILLLLPVGASLLTYRWIERPFLAITALATPLHAPVPAHGQ